jgi:hypothetical protein
MAKYIVVHSVKVATEFVPETFGRLTTIGPKFMLPNTKGKDISYQVCLCRCGSVKAIAVASLRTQKTNSCGCIHRESASKRFATHGLSKHAGYRTWRSMQDRCYNPVVPQYRDWGGRGIRVCDRWLEPNGQGFLNFLKDMGPMPQGARYTIERDRVNENYCPENCRWATYTEQARNKRSNHLLTHNGKTQCVAAWTEELGYSQDVIRSRLRRGWSIEKTLTTPAKVYNVKKNA